MSTKVSAILDRIQTLPKCDQRELWEELGRRITQSPAAGPQLYGEPLTDNDIEESARVSFQALDRRATPQCSLG